MNSASHPQPAAINLQTGARLALIGLFVNVAFAIIKILGGVFGNSYALIADGMESVLDVAGSIVIWGGLRFAARPPDATHPYGHGKAEPLTAIFVALIVVLAAIALIGGEKWRSADNWAAILVCLVIAGIGVRLLRPALYDILDTAPRGAIVDLVRNAAASVEGVVRIDKSLVRKMGLSFYVDLHVEVEGEISVREGHHIAHAVKRAIQESDPRIADVLVHIEPAKQI